MAIDPETPGVSCGRSRVTGAPDGFVHGQPGGRRRKMQRGAAKPSALPAAAGSGAACGSGQNGLLHRWFFKRKRNPSLGRVLAHRVQCLSVVAATAVSVMSHTRNSLLRWGLRLDSGRAVALPLNRPPFDRMLLSGRRPRLFLCGRCSRRQDRSAARRYDPHGSWLAIGLRPLPPSGAVP